MPTALVWLPSSAESASCMLVPFTIAPLLDKLLAFAQVAVSQNLAKSLRDMNLVLSLEVPTLLG